MWYSVSIIPIQPWMWFTPRSGRFAVLFGRLEDVERKFDKLLRFYRSGLSSIGWSEYRTIDIRYNDQVVCKK